MLDGVEAVLGLVRVRARVRVRVRARVRVGVRVRVRSRGRIGLGLGPGLEAGLGLLCRERLVALRSLLLRLLALGALCVALLGAPVVGDLDVVVIVLVVDVHPLKLGLREMVRMVRRCGHSTCTAQAQQMHGTCTASPQLVHSTCTTGARHLARDMVGNVAVLIGHARPVTRAALALRSDLLRVTVRLRARAGARVKVRVRDGVRLRLRLRVSSLQRPCP